MRATGANSRRWSYSLIAPLAHLQGINEDYDKAEEDIASADRELKAYLKEVRGELGAGKEVCFVPLHKETHVIEVPEVRISDNRHFWRKFESSKLRIDQLAIEYGASTI